jgi:hypothetical protein
VADDIIRAALSTDLKNITTETTQRRDAMSDDSAIRNYYALGGVGAAGGSLAIAYSMTSKCKSTLAKIAIAAGLLAATPLLTVAVLKTIRIHDKVKNGIYDRDYLKTEASADFNSKVNEALEIIATSLGWKTKGQINNPIAFEQLKKNIFYDLMDRAKYSAKERTKLPRPYKDRIGISDFNHGTHRGLEGFSLLYILKKTDLLTQFESMSFQRSRRLMELGKDVTDALNLTEKEAGSKKKMIAGLKDFGDFLKDAKNNISAISNSALQDSSLEVIDQYSKATENLLGPLTKK